VEGARKEASFTKRNNPRLIKEDKMKKGFTLLELIVVIIIIGILGTLGLTQYTRMVEKARGAEAKAILGDLRKKAIAFRLERGSLATLSQPALDITTNAGDIPVNCSQTSHYFSYAATLPPTDPTIVLTATRCAAPAGKAPGAAAPTAGQTLVLTSNLTTGVDVWSGTGPWD
jgi:prepilin-type N-terminal cleavage/methylation domain-containing protein